MEPDLAHAPPWANLWPTVSLEQATDPVRTISYGILKPGPVIPEGVPYVRVVNMRRDILDAAALHRTSPEIAARYARASLMPNDVLVSIRGTFGRVVIVPDSLAGANITQDTARLSLLPQLLPRFVAHYLRSPTAQAYMKRLARGVAVKGVNIGDLRAMPLPVPLIEEQRRIVDLLDDHLSRLDAGDNNLDHAERLLVGLREKLVRDVLTGSGIQGPRTRQVPSAEGVEDGVLESLPSGWRWLRLREIAQVVGGVTKDANSQGNPAFVEVPYLRVANVQRGRLALDKITKIRVAPAKADALRLLPGDVLLNEGGDRDKLGRGWVWEGQVDNCIHQNHVFRARVVEGGLHPKLLSWAANTIGTRWCERNGKQSVNLASISLNKIRLMPIPVPPVELQDAMVQRIEDALLGFDRLHGALQTSRSRMTSLRQSLLAAAFSGRLNNGRSVAGAIHV
jgi:type I restriction enzyme S subunit